MSSKIENVDCIGYTSPSADAYEYAINLLKATSSVSSQQYLIMYTGDTLDTDQYPCQTDYEQDIYVITIILLSKSSNLASPLNCLVQSNEYEIDVTTFAHLSDYYSDIKALICDEDLNVPITAMK